MPGPIPETCPLSVSVHPLARPQARRAQGTPGDSDLIDREDGLLGYEQLWCGGHV